QRLLALAQQTIVGVDLNGDEVIAPIPGEGGVAVAYQHAQLMAGIPLKRPAAATAAPEVAATATPKPVAAALAPIRLAIADNSYSQKALSVPVGAIVVWSHEVMNPLTETSDHGSFKSYLLENGATFEHTFNQPGSYLYYCELHGGPAGEGMSAEVRVQ